MAKWGEGDPRWIVEERPDATNVNNWHWTEKNASQWSRDKIEELLKGFEISDTIGNCIITEIDKMEGEASANNRKAKLIFFYEWTLHLKWTGKVTGTTKAIEGTIIIPNLSDENNAEEVDVNVTISSTGPDAEALKEMLRIAGAVKIREQLAKYIKSLKEDFTQGMILPKKDTDTKNGETVKTPKEPGVKLPSSTSTPNINQLSIGGKVEVQSYSCNHDFKCPPSELYNVLTLPELMRAFTCVPAHVNSTVGGNFNLFDGQITGQFLELVPNKKIVQTWRFKTWPVGHFSKVTIKLEDEGDSTKLSLNQTGIPSNEFDKTVDGWQRYYWEAIKRTFGFGAFLL
nr:EOG090X09QT [Megafenestra aurita]